MPSDVEAAGEFVGLMYVLMDSVGRATAQSMLVGCDDKAKLRAFFELLEMIAAIGAMPLVNSAAEEQQAMAKVLLAFTAKALKESR